MNLMTVPTNEMDRVLPIVRDDIERAKAVSGDRYVDGEIERDLRSGRRQLWLAVDDDKIMGTAVTRIYGKVGICQIELCSGNDVDRWLDQIEGIEDWAFQNGWVPEVVGRVGWEKKLKERGYRKVGVILRKDQ